MKRLKIALLIFAALAGLSSCQKAEFSRKTKDDSTRQVVFEGEMLGAEAQTKGLSLVAMPDWRNTDESHIHLFENGVEGTNPKMEIDKDNNRIAYFSATFNSMFEGNESYRSYTGIIAARENDTYSVPAVQTPDSVSLIDPAADFLIGGPKMAIVDDQYTKFKIDFMRPVSLFRLCLINLPKNERISEVVLNAETPLTGSCTADDIYFDRGQAIFDMVDGSKSITLKYDNAKAGTIFYAYFVSCPTSTRITSIVVKTDKNTYTKETSYAVKLTTGIFQSIAVDMNNNVEPEFESKLEQELEFSANELSYEIGGTETFTEPVLSGAVTSPVSYVSRNSSVAVVDVNTGKVTFKDAGSVKIEAYAPEDETYYPGYASYIINVTKSTPATVTYYEAKELEAGKSYVIVSNGKALKNDSGSVATENAEVSGTSVSVAGGSSVLWTVVSVSDSDLLKNGTYQLTNESKYLSRISGGTKNSNLEIHSSSDEEISGSMKYTMWDYDGSYLYNISTSGSSGSGTSYYAYYSSGWKITVEDDGKGQVKFYETRQPQNMSFSKTSVSFDLSDGTTPESPTLNNAQGTVTYSSSAPSVASVNSSTGEVTAKSVGTTVITATTPGDETYQAASASYTLTITNVNAPKTTFYKVTSSEVGQKYLIVSNGYALENADGSIEGVEVTENDGTVEISGFDNMLWIAGTPSNTDYDGLTYSNGGLYLKRDSEEISLDGTADTKYFNFDYTESSSKYYLKCGSYYLYYSTSSKGWAAATSTSGHTATLYTPRQPQKDIAFSSSTCEFDLATGSSPVPPTLNNAYGTLTYSSSKPSVAEVNASTGALTAKSMGTTVITVTAAGNDTYQSASASYTLTVTNSSAVAVSYYKVSEIIPGFNFLIVSNGFALTNDDGSFGATEVTESSGMVSMYEDVSLLWTAIKPESGFDDGTYAFTNNGKSFYRSSGTSSSTFTINSTPDSWTKYYVWDYNDEHITQYSSKYYWFYYSTSDSEWKMTSGSSISSSNKITLYCDHQPQNISFATSEAQIDIQSTSEYTQTASGANTTVTYAITSSSSEGVATIDPTTGKVTANKKGTITVTATAASNDTYLSASASYTLKITDSNNPSVVFTKVTSAVNGGSYLIVSNGYALMDNGGSMVEVAVTEKDGKIELDEYEGMVWNAETPGITDNGYPGFTFKSENKNHYLKGSSSSGVTLEESVNDKYSNFDYKEKSGSYYLMCGDRYFYYSTSSNEWSLSSQSTNHKVTLYSYPEPE